MTRCRSVLWPALATACWAVVVAAGFGALESYKASPGEASSPAKLSAETTAPAPDEDGPLLVVFAHPHCPCTRATLHELEHIAAARQGQLAICVFFVTPDGSPDGWERTELWESAALIPGARVARDAGGAEARRFGAATSGQVFLRDRMGRIVFRGGITAARGHEGDNAGRAAVLALLAGRESPVGRTPVFGCPLFTPCEPCREEGGR